MPADTDKYLESTAEALSHAWLDLRQTDDAAAAAAGHLLMAHEGTERQAWLSALSLAYESLRILLVNDQKPEVLDHTEQRLQAVRQVGWRRAELLAESAWARARMYHPQAYPDALALLRTHERHGQGHAPELDARPLVERVWSDLALCLLYASVEDFPRALECGLRAEADAQFTDHDMVRAQVAQTVAYVYLSVGDVEGACAVIPTGIEASARVAPAGVGLAYNWLLALILSQRFDQASDVLRAYPHVVAPQSLSRLPTLAVLVARVRLAEGRRTEAKALLPSGLLAASDPFHMLSNGIWVGADVLIGFGRAAEARQLIHSGLATLKARGVSLTPMNAAQTYRALADACEADGDNTAALAALRQSLTHGYTWLGKSLQARLQALHFHPVARGTHTTGQTRAQRLQAVLSAVAQARRSAQDPVSEHAEPLRLLLEAADADERRPLDGLLGTTSLLALSELEDRQRQYRPQACEPAHPLLTLCSHVLDLARLDAGVLSLRAEPVSLTELVAQAADQWRPRARARGLALRSDVDPALAPWVTADRQRLLQVLEHLLAQAIDRSPAGEVAVRLQRPQSGDLPPAHDGNGVRLAVQDTGPGLDPQAAAQAFDEFAPASGQPGAGQPSLERALCRRLVQAMGGTIGVDSRPGHGTTFWCAWPLEPAEVPAGTTVGQRTAARA